jgi:exosortase/archaeosortase family protein
VKLPLLAVWLGLLLFAGAPILHDQMVHAWNDASDIKFILLCTAGILIIGFFRLRKSAPKVELQLSWAGLSMLFAASIINVSSSYLYLEKARYCSFLAMCAGLLWALAGRKQFVHWAPLFLLAPFLTSGFAEDTRAMISVPLQFISSKCTVLLAQLIIPISGSGTYFVVKGEPFSVATGCSGLTLWMGLLLGFACWQVFDRFKPSGYALVLLSLLPITLVLNAVRLFITALLAYYFDKDTALAWHTNLEAVLLPIGVWFVWFLGKGHRVQT